MNHLQAHHPSAQRSYPSCKRVLLVNERYGELDCLTYTLQQHGCEVDSSNGYADGLHQLESKFFDFVVVSQGGSQFEGRPVLERAIEIDRRTPIVVVTRSLDMRCYLEAMQLGALDYLESPLAPAEIGRLVETHSRPRTAAATV